MSGPEARYAQGLLAVAGTPSEADKINEVLGDFSALLTGVGEVRSFMLNPTFSGKIKKETALKILPKDTPWQFVNFISLLVDKGRLDLLPGICREYENLKDRMRGDIVITVYSALPLEEPQLEEIRVKYIQKYGATAAKIESRINTSLLGGIRIQIGNFCVDDTLSGRLKRMHRMWKHEY